MRASIRSAEPTLPAHFRLQIGIALIIARPRSARYLLPMLEILGFIFDLVCELIAGYCFGVDVPDTRAGRIFLAIIIAAIGIILWTELR